MPAYYNENDAEKAAWLRELIRKNVIAPGDVDERSITEVGADDLKKYQQCHFFAGIGVWSYALRLAGWADDRPVWTGSCPCPGFSCAGKGGGFDDPRHLWPAWYRLVPECRPATIFGEQSDDAIGYGWLDLVQTDLERENYAVGKAVLGACSVGGSDIRQRLYFVARLADAEHAERRTEYEEHAITHGRDGFRRGGTALQPGPNCPKCGQPCRFDHNSFWCDRCKLLWPLNAGGFNTTDWENGWRRDRPTIEGCEPLRLAHSECGTTERHGHTMAGAPGRVQGEARQRERLRPDVGDGDTTGGLAHALCGRTGNLAGESMGAKATVDEENGDISRERLRTRIESKSRGLADSNGRESGERDLQRSGEYRLLAQDASPSDGRGPADALKGFWRTADWLFCTDGWWRPVEAGTFPLGDGSAFRLGRLRGYGDAINAEVAKAFIEASLGSERGTL